MAKRYFKQFYTSKINLKSVESDFKDFVDKLPTNLSLEVIYFNL